MLWVDCGTLWDSMAPMLSVIRQDALTRANIANRAMRYRRWRYDRLESECERLGCPADAADWRHDGRVRRMISGRSSRERLVAEYGIGWKADMADHDGILFTADPLTAVEWTLAREAEGAERGGRHICFMTRWAAEARPTYRSEFRRYEKHAKKLTSSGAKLIELRDLSLLSLMEGQSENGGVE